MAKRIVDVLVPVALDQPYSYRVPPDLDLAAGDLVRVPLGPRECTGVVWAENHNPNPRLDNRLKDIADRLDIPPLKPELREFVDWVADYTLCPRGMVLRMACAWASISAPSACASGCGSPAASAADDRRSRPRVATARGRPGARRRAKRRRRPASRSA